MAGLSPRIDLIEGSSAIAGALASAAGVTTLVSPNKISVPYTTIVNRASIPDLANDAGVSFGVNRIMVQSIYQLQDEFGPNGEPVWAATNDDRGLIRFVGAWPSNGNDSNGIRPFTNFQGDYIEITFYGTGLNMLILEGGSGTVPQATVSIDGGAASSNVFPTNVGNILAGRNYSTNQVVSCASGLTLGIHTAKIVVSNTPTWSFGCYGFEILNTSSTTSLTVKPGSAIGSQKNTLSSLTTTAYNSGFESGTLGSRGGRVLVYLKSNGTIGKAVTPTDAASATLASASHTNEEVIRVYQPREFGAGRTDDFSGDSLTTRAFTLDDGTTSLIGSLATTSGGFLYNSNASGFITITFVGTGLDIQLSSVSGATMTFTSVSVDGGSSIGSVSQSTGFASYCQKIVSGLPYGTHTVKLSGIGVSASPGISKFIVYGPKKPTLPSGAVELADYNVMADYTAASGTQSAESVSTGILRKSSIRELIYVGSWSGGVNLVALDISGFTSRSTTNGDYFQYTFFGTGFNLGMRGGSGSVAATVTIDGSLYTGAATALNGTSGSGVANWNSGTSTYTADTGYGSRLLVTGLSLGLHTVKITGTSFANTANLNCLDVITPIHSPKSNLLGDFQNTLPVGSQSISDSRRYSTSQLGPQKAWAQAVGVTSGPTTTSTTAVPMPDMSLTVKCSGSVLDVSYSVVCSQSAANVGFYQIYLNGIAQGSFKAFNWTTGGFSSTTSDRILVPVSSGTHKIDVYWYTNAGTLTASGTYRNLTVREL